jgi:ubiquinone/menaquinone biosynthesis C-methylase UbiE
MELSIAIRLIKNGIGRNKIPQTWADFGAGKGLFTQALSAILPEESSVEAVDQDLSALGSISELSPRISVKKMHANFAEAFFPSQSYDGIIMANALHFVRDSDVMLKKIRNYLKPSGRLILIEYDMVKPNAWVPFPISFSELRDLATETGFQITKLDEEPSIYNRANMYSALLTK